jgi:SAM-dependent methyltransferase
MKVLDNHKAEREILETHIRSQWRGSAPIEILEAGCGRKWELNMDGVEFRLTGIDLDAAALEARCARERDLTTTIIGDLRTVTLEPGKYDIIYSSFVMEHVEGAEQVLLNFLRWLKPGGIIILRIPDRDSVHGFMTRFTPFWVHVLYYRYVWGLKDAGKPGFAPYRTVYDAVISRRGLREFSAQHNLIVREELGYGSYRRGRGMFKVLTPLFARTVSLLSLGTVHSKYVDMTYVLESPT